jgi:hypothetical protein
MAYEALGTPVARWMDNLTQCVRARVRVADVAARAIGATRFAPPSRL